MQAQGDFRIIAKRSDLDESYLQIADCLQISIFERSTFASPNVPIAGRHPT
jgi:hypothetical protein